MGSMSPQTQACWEHQELGEALWGELDLEGNLFGALSPENCNRGPCACVLSLALQSEQHRGAVCFSLSTNSLAGPKHQKSTATVIAYGPGFSTHISASIPRSNTIKCLHSSHFESEEDKVGSIK